MSPSRQVHGPRGYPFEGLPYQNHHHHSFGTVTVTSGDSAMYQYGYLPMNAVVQPQYPNPYYHNMQALAYPAQMPPQCPPSYGNLTASQDPSVVCYSCASHPQSGMHPMIYYPPHMAGVPDYYGMYPVSGVPSHFQPHGPPPAPATTIPPPLEFRRSSCASTESNTPPQTPALSSTYVESTASIAGESTHGLPLSPSSDKASKRGKFTIQPRPSASELPPAGAAKNSLYNPSKTKNVYIRGLAPDTDDDKLLELVQQYGPISSHKAIIDKTTGFCKGYGFAMFENMEDAKSCILGVAKVNLDAGFARESFNSRLKALGDPSSTNLYVSNLSTSVDETKMSEIFKDYQTMSVRILRDAQGVSRGVGFVRFANHKVCDEVIEKFNDKVVIDGCPEIQVRYADTYAQKTLKEATTRIREYYCNEQKRAMELGSQGMKVPTGPKFGGQKKWNGSRTANSARPRTFV